MMMRVTLMMVSSLVVLIVCFVAFWRMTWVGSSFSLKNNGNVSRLNDVVVVFCVFRFSDESKEEAVFDFNEHRITFPHCE